jgi:hypothetical protein
MKMHRLIILIFFLSSCQNRSNKKILQTQKDDKGRIVMEITEGYDYGEGSFRRTTYFDTLNRKTKILEVKDNNKTVETFEYSDSSTYRYIYYELGRTDNYADQNFTTSEKDIAFIRHVRLNQKGVIIYMYTKWFGETIHCQENIFDSKGKELSFKYIDCK